MSGDIVSDDMASGGVVCCAIRNKLAKQASGLEGPHKNRRRDYRILPAGTCVAGIHFEMNLPIFICRRTTGLDAICRNA